MVKIRVKSGVRVRESVGTMGKTRVGLGLGVRGGGG